MTPKEKAKNVYRFANGMVATFDKKGEQIPELNGPHSSELVNQIKDRSDSETKWNGFGFINTKRNAL